MGGQGQAPSGRLTTGLLRWVAWGVLFLAVAFASARPAQASEWQQTSVRRTADGVFASASVDLQLSAAMEDALRRAVPFYFVFQAEVLRERWYWADKRVAQVSRTVRLAHQPLTRQWRVSWSSGQGPGSQLPYALHQNHASLPQALAAVSTVSNWLVAEAGRIEPGARHVVNLRFKLDLALLPRPFQLGMNAQDEWAIDLERQLPLPPIAPASDAVPTPAPPPPLPPGAPAATPATGLESSAAETGGGLVPRLP